MTEHGNSIFTQLRKIERGDLVWALLLGLSFSVFYVGIAQDYRTLDGYAVYDNVLFGADHVDALKGWISKHKGTHPLLPLLVVPLSKLFGMICGSYELGLAVLSGCIGGVAIVMFYSLVRMLVPRLPSVILTLLFGFSWNQMVFSGLPDTYILVAMSIMPSFMLLVHGLRTGKVPVILWVIAGLLAFSITITTMVQMVICLAVVLIVKHRAVRPVLAYGVGITAGAVAVATVLVLIQHAIYPGSQLFYESYVYDHEMQYLTPLIAAHPGAVADELIKSFWLFNFVGQDPLVIRHVPGLRVELMYYRAVVDYRWLEFAAVVPWLLVYLWAAFRTFHDRSQRPFTIAAWLCVGSHLALHSFFSTDELFLYAPHYSFIVLLTAVSPATTVGRYAKVAWVFVALMIGAANYQVHARMIERYGGDMPSWLISDDAEWRYFLGTKEPGDGWSGLVFDDGSWLTGKAGFGYGDGDDQTVLDMKDKYSTVYLRTNFAVDSADGVAELFADVNYDDGFVVYLNGERVMARNAPSRISHDSVATADHEGGRYHRYHFSRSALRDGANTIAIVVLNRALDSSDLSMAFRLAKTDRPKER